jgi:HAD superfamily hydrolase (TIGR01509 family)
MTAWFTCGFGNDTRSTRTEGETEMQRVKGVLLDVDGTLVDSNDAHAQAWVRALSEAGVQADFATIRRRIGKGGDKLLPEVAGIEADSPQGKVISKRRGEIFQNDFLPRLRPFPEAKNLLERMKREGLRLAVASSALEDELKELLRVCGAEELVESSTSSDDADNSKPDPDIIQAALKRLSLPPGQVVLLGDTPYDVEAGKRAGVAVVALRCGGWEEKHLTGAAAIYDSPAALLARFEESPFSAAVPRVPDSGASSGRRG